MNKTLEKILIGVGLYYVVTSFVGNTVSNYLEGLQYTVKKAKLSWSPTFIANVAITVPVEIDNMNEVGVTLQDFTGQLIYQGRVLSALSMSTLTLSPLSKSTAELTANVNIVDFGFDIVQLIQAGNFTDQVTVKGILRTSIVNLPIDQTVGLISLVI